MLTISKNKKAAMGKLQIYGTLQIAANKPSFLSVIVKIIIA